MSDNLEWRNKHLVLLRYLTREDMEKNEKFRLDPSVAPVVEGITRAEDMIFKFADVGRWKCASEVITYAAHRRAAIWWLYTCLLSLNEELAINPAVDRDIATIGTDFEVKVPEWATAIQPPTIDPELNSKMDTALEGLEKTYQDMRAKCKPEYLEAIEEGMEVVQEEFKKVHGIRLDQAIEMIKAKLLQDPAEIDPNSPVIVESKKIKEQLKAVQKETVDLIKSVIPPKVPEHEKKIKDSALSAIYAWIASPDEVNSKRCLDVGNECPDTPAGLLALTAFWAGGNLMPGSETVVPTPPGLASNGMSQVLLMMALHKGGTRKLKERYELYFNLGVDILTGKNNWEESLVQDEKPHEKPNEKNAHPAPLNAQKAPADEAKPTPTEYKRWTPPEKQ